MDVFAAVLTDRLMLLIAGLVLAVLWPGALNPHAPARWLKRQVERMAHKLNRAHRSVATRVYRGIILLLFFVSVALLSGYSIEQLAAHLPWFEWLIILALAWLLPVRALREEAAEVGRAVKRNQLNRARGLASVLARREVASLEAHGLLRVAIEHLAENATDRIVAPALWYVALGLPGLLLVRMVNLLDGVVGYKSPQWLAFGWAAARLDDALMWLPARLTGLLMALAALFVPRGRPLGAVRCMAMQAGTTASPNAGWPLSAMAGALGVALGGSRRHQGAVIEDAWLGTGSARVGYADFRRALALFAIAMLQLLLIALLALAALSGASLLPQSMLGLFA